MSSLRTPIVRTALSFLIAGLLPAIAGPTSAPASELTTLYSFTGGADGGNPEGELTFGPDGNLYGTTSNGGTADLGTVFRLIPPQPGHRLWKHNVLFSFTEAAAGTANSVSGVIADANGTLYGTTSAGGTDNFGTVFKLAPPAPGHKRWRHTNITSFVNYCAGGALAGTYPLGGVVFGPDGALYGTTNETCDGTGWGTVFKLTLVARGRRWARTVLLDFGNSDPFLGRFPSTGVIVGPDGSVYGTTPEPPFSSTDVGSVYQLFRGRRGNYNPVLLRSFQSPMRGPHGGLIMDADGALYGTTFGGGNFTNCVSGCGTVFKLTPPAAGARRWEFTTLYEFAGNEDGQFPIGRLTLGADGSLYGTTSEGGQNFGCSPDCGTVYRLSPPVAPATQWTHTVLHTFGSDPNAEGSEPHTGVVLGQDGALYGTTRIGPQGSGTIFRLVP